MDDIKRISNVVERVEERDGNPFLVVSEDGVDFDAMELTPDQLDSREPIGQKLGFKRKIVNEDGSQTREIGPTGSLYLDELMLFGCPGYITAKWMAYCDIPGQRMVVTSTKSQSVNTSTR